MDKHRSIAALLSRHASLLLLMGASLPTLTCADIRVADPAGPTQVTQSEFDVPVVNIAAPNSSGLSHNRFEQFDVDKPGAIFNNSSIAGVSQLGGLVGANPNLTRNALAILTEVTGNQPSTLAGALEVFGGKADIIVANPNGITLNGVTTRNVNGFVTTTGRPQLTDGVYLDVDNTSGRVVIGANGVDTAGLSYFDVVARTVAINGKVGAPGATADVQMVAGQTRYSSQLRTAMPLNSDGPAAPGVAIEGSLAGAMYGRNISLISSDSGVGVRHAGLLQAAENIVIQANGDIDLLPGSSGTQAGGVLHMTAGGVTNIGSNTQADRVTIKAKTLNLNAATLTATGYQTGMPLMAVLVEDLNLNGNWFARDSFSGELLGHDEPLLMEKGTLQVKRRDGRYDERFTLTSDTRIEATGGISITAARLRNNQGIIQQRSSDSLSIQAKSVDNLGLLRSDGDIDLTTDLLNNRCSDATAAQSVCGGIFSNTTATLQIGALDNQAGLAGKDDLHLMLGKGQHSNGKTGSIAAGKRLQVTGKKGSRLVNDGELTSNHRGQFTLDTFDNGLTGRISIFGGLNMDMRGAFTSAGNIATSGLFTLSAQDVRLNRGIVRAGGGITVTASGDISAGPETNLYSRGELSLVAAGSMSSAATISSDGDVVLHSDGMLTNTGSIIGASNMDISSAHMIKNDAGGLIHADEYLTLSSQNNLSNLNNSLLSSFLGLDLNVANTFLNDQSIVQGGQVMINAHTLRNRHASLIHGTDTLNIKVGTVQDNAEGSILQVQDSIIVQAEP